jgi:hypothetical protein
MSTRFFTNQGDQTLLRKFRGVFESNADIEWFNALVGYLRAFSDCMEQIPIPAASAVERSAIESLIEKYLAAHGENFGAWESEINDRVYHLYGLTKDEIKIVEESTTPRAAPLANERTLWKT